MNSQIEKEIEKLDGDLKLSKELKIIKVKEEVLKGFPLLSLKERDLEIKPPFVFSTLYYNRPLGNSKMASAEIELFSPSGDVISEKIYFEFKYSEIDRVEDAKKIESFSIRPEVLYANKVDNFAPDDFTNKYEDIVINKVSGKKKNLDGNYVIISFQFNETYHKVTNPEKFTIDFPIDLVENELTLAQSQTESIEVNVLKMFDHEFASGTKMLIQDLEHFEISPAFLKSSPPTVVNSNFVIPKPYINLIKIDYVPPKDVDSLEAEVLVEYELNGRINSDRVVVFFAMSIRTAAEKKLATESMVNFQFLPKSRKVPPIHMDELDFQYNGDLPLKIIGVEYNHESIDPDDRFVNALIIIRYRTVILKLVKRLEFQYSRNEYINGSWVSAKTENGSITFDKNFINPDVFYEFIDAKTFEFRKQGELIKNAQINPDYPYDSIKAMKLINFDINSRTLMFKVIAIELDGERKIQRSFEKNEKMPWSYIEWKLGKMQPNDLQIVHSYMPEYPTYNLDEKIFEAAGEHKVLSVQYIYPGDDAKSVEVQVQVIAGERSKFITKKIDFNTTYNEYKEKLRTQELINTLRQIRASDISLVLDIDGQPPESISKENILGVPQGVEVKVVYKQPRTGERVARLIIEMKVEKFITGFEQTLIFGKPR